MKEVVIFGTGGHSKVIHDILIKQNRYKPVAFVSKNRNLKKFLGLDHIEEGDINKYGFKAGIIAIGDNHTRKLVCDFIQSKTNNFEFVSAIHPSAQIGSFVEIGSGAAIMANVVVNSGTKIGAHAILNTSCSIDHDCSIEDFVSIAPGAVLGGNVSVGFSSAISLGAKVIHGKKIGVHTVVGAGALVLSDIDNNKVAYGNPCRIIKGRAIGEKYL